MKRNYETFFTSDTHFFHRAMLNLRPEFSSVEDMNEALIERWNSVVKNSHDIVYHLGDFSFGKESETYALVSRLRGRIFLVLGNHDKMFERSKNQRLFEWVRDYHYLRLPDRRIVLSHYPFASWRNSHHGSWHLHGHSHGSLVQTAAALRMDVGVDCNSYTPVSLERVSDYMSSRAFEPVDHHGALGNPGVTP